MTKRGSQLCIVMTALVCWACRTGEKLVEPAPRPASLNELGGNNQSGAVGSTLTSSLAVEVIDTKGAKMSGAHVAWTVMAGGGSVSSATAVTDASGKATTKWTLGTVVGPQTVTALVIGVPPVTFSATATPGATATITIAPGSADVKLDSSVTLVATQKDQYGNPTTESVTWSSSSASAVSVTQGGVARALNVGTATITASVFSGASATATVRAYNPPWLVNQIVVGYSSTCAIDQVNDAYCWSTGDVKPALLAGGIKWSAIAPGGGHSCGIATDGKAYCWGSNSYGQVGDGSTTTRNTPTLVTGGLTWAKIATGIDKWTCALTTTGAAYCWGYNNGRLGAGASASLVQSTPLAVSGARTYTEITTGFDHTCAVSSGAGWCWGGNIDGQLGLGAASNGTNVPTAVNYGGGMATMSAGYFATCGLNTGGAALCWGIKGPMIGSSTEQDAPAPLSGGLTFSKVSPNSWGAHMCAVTSAGAAYCWGANLLGGIGDGTQTDRSVPTPVSGGLTFTSIATGDYGTCGRTSSGQAYCWGGVDGVVNEGSATSRTVPRPVRHP